MKKNKSFFLLLIIIFSILKGFCQSSGELYESGKEKFKEMDYDYAYEDFAKALELDENNTDALLGRAQCYYIFTQYDKALIDLNKAINLNSGLYEAYLYRGRVYFKQGENKEALNDLSKAIEINPEFKEAYAQRAYLYRKLKDPEGALNDFNIIISKNVEDADIYYNRADLLFKEFNQVEKAIKDYSKAIKLKPDFMEAYYYRGLCYETLKNYKEVADNLSKTIELGNRDTSAYKKRAFAYFLSENYTSAIMDYTYLINKFRIRDDVVYFNRGVCYSRTGNYAEAVKDFTKSLMFDRENVNAFIERGNANWKMNLTSTAQSDYINAVKAGIRNPAAYEARGKFYKFMNKWDLAAEDYGKAIELLKKPKPELYFNRGECREVLKDIAGACEDFSSAAKLGYQPAEEKLASVCKQ